MFLNCSKEGSDCLTVNISEDFIREALKHFMSFGAIVDWEERLSWLSSYVKNTNNIVDMIDIGGPSLLRASAKNFRYITTIIDKNDYKKYKSWKD